MKLLLIALVVGFGIYAPPPRVPLGNFIVDECAPGYVANPPDYAPPCVRIAEQRFRGYP